MKPHRHRILWAILLVAAAVGLSVGLFAWKIASQSAVPTPIPTETPAPPVEPTATPVALRDDIGNLVVVAEPAERIVSLAPSNTEIVFALGIGDRLVGVTDFCDYPPEAQTIAKIGGVEPNIEAIVALDPDLVLAIGGDPVPPSVARLQELGLTVLTLEPHDLESLYRDILLVGQATGAEEQAEALVADMRARVAAVAARTENVAERPVVFYELDATDPSRPFTAGAGSWHDAFIRLAGGVNLAGDQERAWVQISAEEIIARDPDVIILGDANWGVTPEVVAQRPGWDVVSAVREGRVYPIDGNIVDRPGPRVVEGIEQMARMIHPELFGP